jgi:hypothetical protein
LSKAKSKSRATATTAPLTAPARLRLLLDWLNGRFDEHHFVGHNPEPVAVWTDYPAIRRALAAFVGSFDGTAGTGYVVAKPDDNVSALDDEAIGELGAMLNILLEQGFGEPSLQDFDMPLRSLRMQVRGVGRQKPKIDRFDVTENGSPMRKGFAKKLRAFHEPGAYVLHVRGPISDLVPFLLAHLLTAPNMVAVNQCQRPGCSGLVVQTGQQGPPQKFCSELCRGWNRAIEQQQKRRER